MPRQIVSLFQKTQFSMKVALLYFRMIDGTFIVFLDTAAGAILKIVRLSKVWCSACGDDEVIALTEKLPKGTMLLFQFGAIKKDATYYLKDLCHLELFILSSLSQPKFLALRFCLV